ncbi:hypothetical protein RFI_08997, partial [Reticulomyxa filosa]
EMVYKVFVINAPSMFKSCWKIVKTFMDPVTINKVKMFSASEVQLFFNELNMIAHDDMIPSSFGGKANFTIRLSDVPSECSIDLTKSYPYTLPEASYF